MKTFNGFKKAITFSYDDGCFQDVRLFELFWLNFAVEALKYSVVDLFSLSLPS